MVEVERRFVCWILKKFGFMHQRLLPHSHTTTWHVCPVYSWHQYNCKTYTHSIKSIWIRKNFWSKKCHSKKQQKTNKLFEFLHFTQLLIDFTYFIHTYSYSHCWKKVEFPIFPPLSPHFKKLLNWIFKNFQAFRFNF